MSRCSFIGDAPGVDPTGVAECSGAINAALAEMASRPYIQAVNLGPGSFVIDPSVGIRMPDKVALFGAGEDATEIVASNSLPGSLVQRDAYDPLSSSNSVYQRHRFGDFRIVVKGPQVGLDMRHLSRAHATGIFVTKWRIGENEGDWNYVPGSKGVALGTANSAGLQPGYAWGDGSTVERCRAYACERSIEISAGHAHRITGCDLAHADLLVNVPTPNSAGIVIRDNILQYCEGRFAVDFNGEGGLITGNYFENTQVSAQVLLRSGSLGTVTRDNYFYPPGTVTVINDGAANRTL